MLAHICCSVDSRYFLKKLREILPHENIIGFFYNPNIHPYNEYKLRLLDVQRSCAKYGIALLEGEYDLNAWLKAVKGLENEAERGARCEVCFEERLEVTAKKAKELGEKRITTTLFMSPKKSFEQLNAASEKIAARYDMEALCFDFRKNGGTQAQFELARTDKLYRQNYCGCMYALICQREAQKRFCGELLNPLGKEILPSSIEERLDIYEKVVKCEKEGIDFALTKEKFQNYRLLWGRVLDENGNVVPSWFLGAHDGNFEAAVKSVHEGCGFAEHALFVELWQFNKRAKRSYKSIKELIFNPPPFEEQKNIHAKFVNSFVVVVENIKKTTCKIEVKSTFYEDVREVLAIL
ncbi:MAG: epoxyqueuosine reductase QueH [Campylobacteraceae bacterium]|jgi:predicted adenine nucleotide alpha hydrolase (AANH) superfamily ATPase|nr:epoxyqueuosine reductase QueH [Campylobacteraceae bacterium]